MKTNSQLTRRLAIYAALAAISALFQLFHIGFKTQWGMWIDIVAVPWIVAYFLFGFKGGLTVSFVGSIIITLIAPDTWLGASAKFIATVPMFLTLHTSTLIFKKKINQFKKPRNIILPILIAVGLRGIFMLFFNYYFALPIWIPGKTFVQLMSIFPWYIIVGINAIQGIIDVVFAWLLVFPYKLSRFGQKNN
ncbi:MAG: ECF transporter S component [Candidatus Roizmanbacteria bacterium]|nr:ECF transporter S component [Candidatus Roizmanbacteria bacterium]